MGTYEVLGTLRKVALNKKKKNKPIQVFRTWYVFQWCYLWRLSILILFFFTASLLHQEHILHFISKLFWGWSTQFFPFYFWFVWSITTFPFICPILTYDSYKSFSYFLIIATYNLCSILFGGKKAKYDG